MPQVQTYVRRVLRYNIMFPSTVMYVEAYIIMKDKNEINEIA